MYKNCRSSHLATFYINKWQRNFTLVTEINCNLSNKREKHIKYLLDLQSQAYQASTRIAIHGPNQKVQNYLYHMASFSRVSSSYLDTCKCTKKIIRQDHGEYPWLIICFFPIKWRLLSPSHWVIVRGKTPKLWAYTSTGQFQIKAHIKWSELNIWVPLMANHQFILKVTIFGNQFGQLRHVIIKIKYFIWRSCRDILPTKLNLTRRKIMHDVGCECCEDGGESIDRVLLRSQHAKEVWSFTS